MEIGEEGLSREDESEDSRQFIERGSSVMVARYTKYKVGIDMPSMSKSFLPKTALYLISCKITV